MFANRRDTGSLDSVVAGNGKTRVNAGRLLVSPRILPVIAAARRFLPFRLGRQPFARPAAILVGIMPINAGHRQLNGLFYVLFEPPFGSL